MVLADIEARGGDVGAVLATLHSAQQFHARYRDDFEVRVNFRVEDWLEQALRAAAAGDLAAIRAYPFAR
jgi:hypothetical protein